MQKVSDNTRGAACMPAVTSSWVRGGVQNIQLCTYTTTSDRVFGTYRRFEVQALRCDFAALLR